MNFLLVFLGGGVGCLLRYLIGRGVQGYSFFLPLGTFISNILACLIFAGTMWFLQMREQSGEQLRMLLLTGFCGGLSTFSTFGYETFIMLKQDMFLYAFLNIFASISLGLLIFYLFKI